MTESKFERDRDDGGAKQPMDGWSFRYFQTTGRNKKRPI